MEADPDAGIIQTLPLIINRNTFFARLQQFAARISGPVIAAGLACWMGRDGNYWGHNAIIRTRAFADHCGLPDLPGKPPFGGHILSHDFVEAALIRRAGWAVYMLPTLGGSYEESPPSLIDLAARDRRWCQGNLQHARVLPRQRLRVPLAPASRQRHHGLSRLAAVDGAIADRHRAGAAVEATSGRNISPAEFSLFPTWPRFDYRARAATVRGDDRGAARAQDLRHDRRRCVDRPDPARLRRRHSAVPVDADRNARLGGARFDHDGDPVGRGAADPFRPRHRLEPAAARRRLDPARQPSCAATARTRRSAWSRCWRRACCRLRWSCGCRRPSPASSCRSRCRGRAARCRSASACAASAC